MSSKLQDGVATSSAPRKRPLARRSCLKCREKKARCELPDINVESSKKPLQPEKKCHRCNVLGIDCVVWDGDRKRKPRLDREHQSASGRALGSNTGDLTRATTAVSSSSSSSISPRSNQDEDAFQQASPVGPAANRRNTASLAPESEHLGASDLSHAQRLLINRQKGWKTMTRSLLTLVERLQREKKYSTYLTLRIDAPPSTPDIVTFLQPDKLPQLEQQLLQHLVGHPYLPSLSSLHKDQTQSPSRARGLLLATMTSLAMRGNADELASSDMRNLSNYIDRLGTQLLLSSPRDVHLVMAFELLLSHDPGLVGTAASQFEPEGRGYGLASENLIFASIKIAKELGLEQSTRRSYDPAVRLAHLSLWSCLRVWEALYAFLGRSVVFIDDLNERYASTVRDTLHSVDGMGQKWPSAPRHQDANGPTASSYREMRQFCEEMELQHGRDGILRSAGRTLVSLRTETVCHLFSSMQEVHKIHVDAHVSPEEKWKRIDALHSSTTGAIMAVRDCTEEQLGVYAGQRLVRLWEQFVHIECEFLCTLFGSFCSSTMICGELNGAVDANHLVRTVRFGLGPAEHVSKIGKSSMDTSRVVLSSIANLDRQPAIQRHSAQNRPPSQYLHRLPTLLVSAMAVDAARSCLESIAFVLVAWGRNSFDAPTFVTLMEAAAERVRLLSPRSSSPGADTVAQVAADYIDEMVDTIQLWGLYYRVYRPLSGVEAEQTTTKATTEQRPFLQTDAGQNPSFLTPSSDSIPQTPTSAMDFLASAAEAAQSSAEMQQHASHLQRASLHTAEGLIVRPDPTPFTTIGNPLLWGAQITDGMHSGQAGTITPKAGYGDPLDPSIYNACIPFDLEAFLRDVDQLL